MLETLERTYALKHNPLTITATTILDGVSRGVSDHIIARNVGLQTDRMRVYQRQICEAFDTSLLSVAVSAAIENSFLTVKPTVKNESDLDIDDSDKNLLRFFARTGQVDEVGQALGVPIETIDEHLETLLESIGAQTRPHGVRKVYEIGMLTTRSEEGVN